MVLLFDGYYLRGSGIPCTFIMLSIQQPTLKPLNQLAIS
jgi:hypothetical protein